MKTTIIAVLSFLASPVLAASTVQSPAYSQQLVQVLLPAAGATVIRSECKGDDCIVTWTDGPTPYVPRDYRAERAARVAEAQALEDKLDAGTITQAELRRLLKIIIQAVKISKDTPP